MSRLYYVILFIAFLFFVLLQTGLCTAKISDFNFTEPQNTSGAALVIGNADYATTPLQNPVDDARAMAQRLTKLGFEVILETNVEHQGMMQAIRSFEDKLQDPREAGFFYYSGRGTQLRGKNYLIPVNHGIKEPHDIQYEAVQAQYVLDMMRRAGKQLNIVILDAGWEAFCTSCCGFCPDRCGLAMMEVPVDSIVAYAMSPGKLLKTSIQEQGLYTKHLLQNMENPNWNIEKVLKNTGREVHAETSGQQTPCFSSTLLKDYYFTVSEDAVDEGRTSKPGIIVQPRQAVSHTTNVPPRLKRLASQSSRQLIAPARFTPVPDAYGLVHFLNSELRYNTEPYQTVEVLFKKIQDQKDRFQRAVLSHLQNAGTTEMGSYIFRRKSAKPQAGRNWALLIGLSDYAHILDLKAPVRELQELSKTLKEKYQFSDSSVVQLFDEAATCQRIENELQSLEENATTQDTILVCFSGHSIPDKEKLYLLTHEAGNLKTDPVGRLDAARLQEFAKYAKARNILFVLDCGVGRFGEIPR